MNDFKNFLNSGSFFASFSSDQNLSCFCDFINNTCRAKYLKLLPVLIALLIIPMAFAIPNVINIQGKLTDAQYNAQSGTHNFTFTIYNALTGGNARYSENISLNMSQGLWSHQLGSNNTIALNFSEDYYVEIIANGQTLIPRLRLSSVGFSYKANVSDNVSANSYALGNFTIIGNVTIRGNGTFNGSTICTENNGVCPKNVSLNYGWNGTLWQPVLTLADGTLRLSVSQATVYNITAEGNATNNFTVVNNLIVGKNLTVNTNTLFVDSANARVGIGMTSPNTTLNIRSNGNILRFTPITAGGVINFVQVDNGLGSERARFSYDIDNVKLGIAVGATVTTPHVTIDGSGLVGIATVAPVSEFEVNGTAPTISLQNGTLSGRINFDVNSTGDLIVNSSSTANLLIVQKGGNVGIGTASPTEILHVASESNAGLRLQAAGADASVDDRIVFLRSDGTLASKTIVSNGDRLARIIAQGYNGTAFRSAAEIQIVVDGTPGASDMPARIAFFTSPDGSASPAERVRIDNAGNLGINTTSPSGLLQVNVNGSDVFHINETGRVGIGTAGPGKKLVVSTGIHQDAIDLIQTNAAYDTGYNINSKQSLSYFGGWSTTTLYLNGNADWTGGVTIGSFAGAGKVSNLTINGNVGIGTAGPGYLLDVNGTLRVSGASTLAAVSATTGTFTDDGSFGTTSGDHYLNIRAGGNGISGWRIYAGAGATLRTQFLFNDNSGSATLSSPIGQPIHLSLSDGTVTAGAATFSGNVGIGTVAPAATLHVNGSGSSSSGLRITNGTTEVMYVNTTSGNVGIGTAAPQSKLEVAGGFNVSIGGASKLYVNSSSEYVGIGTTSPESTLEVNGNLRLSAVAAASRYIILGTNAAANTGTGALVIQAGAGSGGYGGAINLFAHSHATKPGWVTVGISASAGSGATEGRFTVDDSATGGTNLFTVLRTGNVGINTTSPGALLHVAGNASAGLTAALFENTNVPDNTNYIQLALKVRGYQSTVLRQNSDASSQTVGSVLDTVLMNTYTAGGYGKLILGTNGSAKVTIDQAGNVAINASTATALLDVQGSGSCKIWGNGNLTCTGTKNALVNTSSYGWRKLYAAESTTNRFSDEGFGQTINGTATIMLDPIYMETVNTNVSTTEGKYLVHVTAYGKTSLYVEAVYDNGFVVKSTDGNNTEFAWQVSALRRGYEQYRLEAWNNG